MYSVKPSFQIIFIFHRYHPFHFGDNFPFIYIHSKKGCFRDIDFSLFCKKTANFVYLHKTALILIDDLAKLTLTKVAFSPWLQKNSQGALNLGSNSICCFFASQYSLTRSYKNALSPICLVWTFFIPRWTYLSRLRTASVSSKTGQFLLMREKMCSSHRLLEVPIFCSNFWKNRFLSPKK